MYSNILSWTQQKNWPIIIDEQDFEKKALQLFHYQFAHNEIYRQFAEGLRRHPDNVQRMTDIPFLPVSFFKTHEVLCQAPTQDMLYFESSGTTGTVNSKHYVPDASLYERSFNASFRQFYGKPEEYIFLCLLPSYLEKGHSSLIYMANSLIQQSGRQESKFVLQDTEQLATELMRLKAAGEQIILLGVTYALLDFARDFPLDLTGVIVMETGGM